MGVTSSRMVLSTRTAMTLFWPDFDELGDVEAERREPAAMLADVLAVDVDVGDGGGGFEAEEEVLVREFFIEIERFSIPAGAAEVVVPAVRAVLRIPRVRQIDRLPRRIIQRHRLPPAADFAKEELPAGGDVAIGAGAGGRLRVGTTERRVEQPDDER